MHTTNLSLYRHHHDFSDDTSSAERRTHRVIALTFLMMVVEIVAGTLTHSMALLADGWHMSTHVGAFFLAALAYYFGRRHANDQSFTFGSGKIRVLGAYTSAVVLSGIALLLAVESVHRLIAPLPIHFREAGIIASMGLAVNIISALLLKDTAHPHCHGHDHGPVTHNHDLNLRAAYVHVLADALTSLLAIAALSLGYFLGWTWLDPAMGLVGTVVIISWAYTLVRDTAAILLDRIPSATDLPVVIREAIETDGDSLITDLHVWQVGEGKFAAIVSVVAHNPKSPNQYRAALKIHEELVHVTIEVQPCHETQGVAG